MSTVRVAAATYQTEHISPYNVHPSHSSPNLNTNSQVVTTLPVVRIQSMFSQE